jgi:hypothetical protein
MKRVFFFINKIKNFKKFFKNPKNKFLLFKKSNSKNLLLFNNFIKKLKKFFYYSNISINNNYSYNYILKKTIRYLLYNELSIIRRYKFNLNFLNKYKFNKIFLQKLSNLIKKIYKKDIEFNIINLRSIILNSDIFTEFLKLKLKRRRIRLVRAINFITAKMKFPKLN